MSEFTGMTISAVLFGVALGLMALGFTISYTVSRVFNFAVGQVVIFPALLAVKLPAGIPVALKDLIAIGVTAVGGVVIYLVAIRWPESHGAEPLTLVIITFGVGLVIEQVVSNAWGSYSFSAPTLISGGFSLDHNSVPWQGVLFVAAAVVSIGALGALQRSTVVGKQLVALGSSRETARHYGINDVVLVTFAWGLSFAVLGLAGSLYFPLTGASITTDLTYGVDAFAAAVVGGVGNPGGALAGGLLVAFVATGSGVYLNPNIGDVFTFGLLFLFLIFWPNGLTGSSIDLAGPRA